MAFDTSKLFGVEAKDVKREKLPTLAQYLKKTKEPKSKPVYVVELVWLPGKFNNFTLQTNKFRIIVSPSHPFYGLLRDFFADNSTAETPMSVRITDWQLGSYQLEQPKCAGLWSELGTSGYRWVDDEF
jgi:hypothetical protein